MGGGPDTPGGNKETGNKETLGDGCGPDTSGDDKDTLGGGCGINDADFLRSIHSFLMVLW